MSTLADVKAAEDEMIKAQKAVADYVDRHEEARNSALHRSLVDELKAATDKCLQVVINLGSK